MQLKHWELIKKKSNEILYQRRRYRTIAIPKSAGPVIAAADEWEVGSERVRKDFGK